MYEQYWQDRKNVALSVDRDHPGLLERARREGEVFRGAYVDQLAHRLNRIDGPIDGHLRWGRKARRNNPDDPRLNDDALTFMLDPNDFAKKKLIDVVHGSGFQPGWDVRPAVEEPGNGFWHPPVNADLDGDVPPPPPPPPPPDGEITLAQVYAKLVALEQRFDRVFR